MKTQSKREPGIHITQARLRTLMLEFHDYADGADDMVDEMIEYIVQESPKYTLEKRSVNITRGKLAKQVMSKVVNDKSDSSLLSSVIFSVRKSLKHRGIRPITNETARDWASLNKLAPVINQFCQEFDLSKREGYIKYIQIGLSMFTSYNHFLLKLIDLSEKISTEYDSLDQIAHDTNKSLTKQIHDYYVQRINKKTGIMESFIDNPKTYLNFVRVREVVERTKVKYQTYIDAQFDALEWTMSYPSPEQLSNDKSNERLNKFVYKNKVEDVRENRPDEKLTNILTSIKNGKNHH